MPRKKLASMIVAARKLAGYDTRYQLHKKTGVPMSTLGSIERGECSPTVETMERIMKSIGREVVVTFRERK